MEVVCSCMEFHEHPQAEVKLLRSHKKESSYIIIIEMIAIVYSVVIKLKMNNTSYLIFLNAPYQYASNWSVRETSTDGNGMRLFTQVPR